MQLQKSWKKFQETILVDPIQLINRTNYELVIDRIDRENIRIVPFLPFLLTTRVACFRRIREKEDWKGIRITRRCENTQDRKNER